MTLQGLEDPTTGQRMTFRSAGGESEPMQVDMFVRPGGYVCSHVHPRQKERFTGIAGELWFRAGRSRRVVRPGDVLVVSPGVAHKFVNRSGAEAHVLVEVTPPWPVESVLLLMSLCRDGKVRMPRYGVPRPLLQIVALGERYLDEVCLPYVPLALQRLAFRALYPLAVRRGYRAAFPEYEPRPGSVRALG